MLGRSEDNVVNQVRYDGATPVGKWWHPRLHMPLYTAAKGDYPHAMGKKKHKTPSNVIGVNRQARHHYHLEDPLEAGISLRGTEVKSLREGQLAFKDGYVDLRDGQAMLRGIHIAPYEKAGQHAQHDPERPRRLLLHKGEIERLAAKADQKGYSVVPVKLYFARGKIKVEIALGKGKKVHDKREDIKQRDMKKDVARQLKDY